MMGTRRTFRLGLPLLALAGLCAGLAACTVAPPREVAGPPQAQPMDHPGPFSGELVSTTRREGVSDRFLLLRPQHPVASVILFTGGEGVIGLTPAGPRRTGNFLVRTRLIWAQQGMMVALVDPPSDRSDLSGHFRISQAHALDIKGVIAYLREQAPVPVWLVGTSYGTVSALKVADRLADGGGPDGVVVTSSLFREGRVGGSVWDADPARIRVPLLIVHHRGDRCPATPFSQTAVLEKRMVNAHPAEVIGFTGGGPTRGDVCEPFDYHGYPGIEDEVVSAITAWIKAHPPR